MVESFTHEEVKGIEKMEVAVVNRGKVDKRDVKKPRGSLLFCNPNINKTYKRWNEGSCPARLEECS